MPIDPKTGLNAAGNRRGTAKGSAKPRKLGQAKRGDQRALKSGAFVSDAGVKSLVTSQGTTFAESVKFAQTALENAGTYQPAFLTACERYVRLFHRFRHLDDQGDGLTAAQTKEKSRLTDQLTALERELGLTPASQAQGQFLVKAAKAAEAEQRRHRRPDLEKAHQVAVIQQLVRIGAVEHCYFRDPDAAGEAVNPIDPRERR